MVALGKYTYWVSIIALGVIIAIFSFKLIEMYSPIQMASSYNQEKIFVSYVDVVTIILTAVTVILAALGFVVAVLAVIGWNSIGDRVATLATTFLTRSLQEGGELHQLVKTEANSIIYKGISPIDAGNDDLRSETNEGTDQ